MKLRRIKEILHVCEKTIDNYANRIGASDEIVEYIENLQSQLKAKEEVIKKFEKYLNDCVSELENNYGTSSIQNAINTGIVDITKVILSKFNEILSKGENK